MPSVSGESLRFGWAREVAAELSAVDFPLPVLVLPLRNAAPVVTLPILHWALLDVWAANNSANAAADDVKAAARAGDAVFVRAVLQTAAREWGLRPARGLGASRFTEAPPEEWAGQDVVTATSSKFADSDADADADAAAKLQFIARLLRRVRAGKKSGVSATAAEESAASWDMAAELVEEVEAPLRAAPSLATAAAVRLSRAGSDLPRSPPLERYPWRPVSASSSMRSAASPRSAAGAMDESFVVGGNGGGSKSSGIGGEKVADDAGFIDAGDMLLDASADGDADAEYEAAVWRAGGTSGFAVRDASDAAGYSSGTAAFLSLIRARATETRLLLDALERARG